MINSALERGVDIKSRARQVSKQDLLEFDLILAMDNENFLYLTSLAKESTFPIKATIRTMLSYSNKINLVDVPDPYYGGESGFDAVLDLLQDSCEGLLEELIKKG